jgi:hypothetical protein
MGNQMFAMPAEQLDYKKIMADAAAAAKSNLSDQYEAAANYYPQMEGLQLGTIGKLAANLNTPYTQQAKASLDQAQALGQGGITAIANKINSLGDISGGLANQALWRAYGGPSTIEQQLYDRANSDLALGSRLNPEEERAAAQQASSAWSSRGLGTGASAASADLLNRYQYAQARLQQRMGNAQAANQTMEQGIQGRQNTALGLLGNTANIFGQSGGAFQNAATLGINGANALINLDPYQRALGTGAQLGSGIASNNGQMIGNAYNQAGDLASNVASFNANMLDTRYNSMLNNDAAKSAAKSASNGQMLGAGMGAIGSIGMGAAIAI